MPHEVRGLCCETSRSPYHRNGISCMRNKWRLIIILFIIVWNSKFRVPYVIFVKRGCATVENVWQLMLASVHYKMQIAPNVNVERGIMVAAYLCARIVQCIYVKTINLNIKLRVRFWSRKIINVIWLFIYVFFERVINVCDETNVSSFCS